MIVLYKLIEKLCNRSKAIVDGDIMGNLIESLYNFLLIGDDNYDCLVDYHEASEHRYRVLKNTGFDFVEDSLRNAYITELLSHKKSKLVLYK